MVAVEAAEDEPAGDGPGPPRRTARGALLLLPVAATAATLALPPDRPRLFGVPLFYVLHFTVCLLSAAVTALLQRLSRASGEPAGPPGPLAPFEPLATER
ncbi:hypothetical protein OHS33_15335 [Streptomyces sp. NBC_00536]|uniref:hypothetical protein n=1 Tax=Streptomyces sp. NBC_00536 TaxID=2975769 RepID=UPI002E811955|nr:hypothetical protein [Streptomyces sp. NBC_00536]WUC79577.1 hypothetical protein OHS33_15335 [Streptomyces sp. NBC_00536]